MLKNMRIGSRLFIGFGLVLLLTTATTFFAIHNMGRIQANLEAMAKANGSQASPGEAAPGKDKAGSADALYAEAVAMYGRARTVMYALTCAVIALAALIATFLTRGIVRPLNQALLVADALASGNLNRQVEVKSSDEIGSCSNRCSPWSRS